MKPFIVDVVNMLIFVRSNFFVLIINFFSNPYFFLS